MNLARSYWDRYYDLGWSTVPIQPGTKLPFHGLSWKKYQTQRPTKEQIATWARTWPKSGLAVITGAISGVVVIDVDRIPEEGLTAQQKALALVAKELVAGLPPTATARTSKGRHLYFKHPGRWIPTKIGRNFLPGLDVRGDGGYALLPPSIHPSGWVYAWETPPEDGIAEMPEHLIKAICETDAYLESELGIVKRRDYSETGLVSLPNGTWKTALAGVGEGDRNGSATQVIGKLLQQTDTELWELQWEAVKQWNERNNPPLSEKELRTTFNSIAKSEREKRKPSKANVFDVASLEGRDLPETTYAVKNLVSGFTILVAKPKIGKSQLALQIGLAVTQGEPLFPAQIDYEGGKLEWTTRKGPVLYLDLEDSERRLHDRVKAMTQGKFPKNFFATLKAPTLGEGGDKWLQQQIETIQPSLIIIDMLPTWLGLSGSGGKGVYQSEYLTMRLLWELSASTQVPILALQHARKDPVGKGIHPDPFDSANGTLGGPGAADTIIVLQQRSLKRPGRVGTKAATLYVRGRDVPEYELPLVGNPTTKSWRIES